MAANDYSAIALCVVLVLGVAHDMYFQLQRKKYVERLRKKSLEDTLVLLGLGQRKEDK